MITFSFLTVYKNQLKKKEILNVLLSDHSPVFCSFVNNDTFARGSGVWKHNTFLLFNTDFVEKSKIHIEFAKANPQEKSSLSDHTKLGFLKYEIRSFSISFSKNLAKREQIIHTNLESRNKTLEQNFKNEEDFNSYNLFKLKLENIYNKNAKVAKIPGKCEWYKHGENQ